MQAAVMQGPTVESRVNAIVERLEGIQQPSLQIKSFHAEVDDRLKRFAESVAERFDAMEQRLNEMQVDVESDFDEISKRVNNLECVIPTERPQQPAPVELSEKAAMAVFNSRSNGLNITITYGRCYVATLDDEDVWHGFTLASLVERINAHFEGK